MKNLSRSLLFIELSHDGWLLFATCGIRSFAYGFLSVILGLYLAAVGMEAGLIGANFLAALSFLFAAPLARRIGLLNTMVFTHLPSNLLLLLVPLMPTLELTVVVFLLRHLLSQLDVPTRQSYTMAIVKPHERSAAAGIMSVARNGAAALAPAFSGWTLAMPVLGFPFVFAGGLKIVYDICIYLQFRRVRPPEETARPIL